MIIKLRNRRQPGQRQSLDTLWAHHHAQFRESHAIVTQYHFAAEADAALLQFSTRGDWWEIVEQLDITLLVTREYEHLVMALTVENGKPRISYLALPHPSGLAVDLARKAVYLASTRNPNA